MDRKKYQSTLLIKELRKEDAKKLSETKVLIAGTGILGSIVLTNLISLKIGEICVIDTNEKQYKNNKKLLKQRHFGKNIQVCNSIIEDVEKFIYIEDYDIIIDCLDSYSSKFTLNKIAINKNKPLIHGSVTENYGQVTTIIPHKTACLNCLFPNTNNKDIKINNKICPAINAIAALQSQAAIDIILKQNNDLVNILLTYNTEDLQLKKIKLSQNSKCEICSNMV